MRDVMQFAARMYRASWEVTEEPAEKRGLQGQCDQFKTELAAKKHVSDDLSAQVRLHERAYV